MSLPPRSFYSLTEVAVRWSVMPFDVIGWSTDGLLALSIAVPPVKTEPAETLPALPMSRRRICSHCSGAMERQARR